jgi:hypothetical protein
MQLKVFEKCFTTFSLYKEQSKQEKRHMKESIIEDQGTFKFVTQNNN